MADDPHREVIGVEPSGEDFRAQQEREREANVNKLTAAATSAAMIAEFKPLEALAVVVAAAPRR